MKTRKTTSTRHKSTVKKTKVPFDFNQFWKDLFENSDKVSLLVKRLFLGVAIVIAVCKGQYLAAAIVSGGGAIANKIQVWRSP